jgi:hypothetical protein
MKGLWPVFFKTSDAPRPGTWDDVDISAIIDARFAQVQAFRLAEAGATFSLYPTVVVQGHRPATEYIEPPEDVLDAAGNVRWGKGTWTQYVFYKELLSRGYPIRSPDHAFYLVVWAPDIYLGRFGHLPSTSLGGHPDCSIMMDGPASVQDFLGLPKSDPTHRPWGESWAKQAVGRLDHETLHWQGRQLTHDRADMPPWWDWGRERFAYPQNAKVAVRSHPFSTIRNWT